MIQRTGKYAVFGVSEPAFIRQGADERVSFEFKIRYSFKCPTKFKASGTSASITGYANVVDQSDRVTRGKTYPYKPYVGTKYVLFTTGDSSTDTVTGLRRGRSYEVSVSSPDKSDDGLYIKRIYHRRVNVP